MVHIIEAQGTQKEIEAKTFKKALRKALKDPVFAGLWYKENPRTKQQPVLAAKKEVVERSAPVKRPHVSKLDFLHNKNVDFINSTSETADFREVTAKFAEFTGKKCDGGQRFEIEVDAPKLKEEYPVCAILDLMFWDGIWTLTCFKTNSKEAGKHFSEEVRKVQEKKIAVSGELEGHRHNNDGGSWSSF